MEMVRSQRKLEAVPRAPALNAIPDLDSILSCGKDFFFDVNVSQHVRPTQKKQSGTTLQEHGEKLNISASGDCPSKKAKVYPVIHKVDPRLVSRNGKKASAFTVPDKTPVQRHGRVSHKHNFGSQEDLFEDFEDYFEQATPYGDSLYTPAPLIVPVCSQGVGRMKLRSVTEITENYRRIFDFPYFNIVQSKVFDDVMYTDKPLVLCSPTGSGKTAVFEMAIVRLMTRSSSSLNTGFKIVYMAPIKALCSERYNDWKEKLEPLGLKCMELTGDTEVDDFYRLQEVQIILTTPEKWDSMTRKWRDNASVMQAICLFLIDEIHILNDCSRGSTVEAVVTRMKTMQAARARTVTDSGLPPLRFVAVSATITNIEDVAEWLGNANNRAVFYKMDDSVRPVRLRKVVLGYHYAENKQSEFQFDLTLSYKLAAVIKTYSEDKPTLVFCSTRKSAQQSAEILSKDMKSSFIKSAQHRQQLNNLSFHVKDGKLRDLICKGIGYHHAGMDLQDRKNVEEAFASGELPVLVSTSTLAMGVNLPAHLVIVKSTMFYNLGVYQEYPDIQVLQMIGRAGRPQFDTSATAVIMTKNQTKIKYENLLNGTQLIESSLHKNLIEHLNAEIVLHTISDISVAVEWLKYTFLYIRVFKNPKHYSLPLGLTKDSIEKRLQDMCMKDLKQLSGLSLVNMDEENLDLKPLESGKLMARYCISFKTMQLFFEVKGAETVSELVSLISKCQEFTDIQLRTNEKKTLNTLNRDKNRITIRYPMQGKIKTTDMKVNCLIQTAFGNLMLQDFALQQDTGRIFRAGTRVTRCLVELLWHKQDFKALLSALQLCKCFKARLWEDSKFVCRQLEGIGPALSNALVNAGVTSFEKVEGMNPRDIELIVNRHPPFGNQVRDGVSALPKYELVIEQVTRYAVNTSEIMMTIQLSNRVSLKDKPSTNHTCTLLIGDQDNKIVYKQRIMDIQLLKEGSWSKKLDIKHAAKGPDLFIHYISQDWVGLDVECTFTPNYLGGRRITNTGPALSPKEKTLTGITSGGTDKTDVIVPCNHQCHNKQLCAHECCKTGVSARKRQQRSHDTKSHDRDKSCGRSVQNHITDLRSRVASMPPTPGQLKRPRLEFKGSAGPGPKIDLSKFVYTGRNPVNNVTTTTPAFKPTESEQDHSWESDPALGSRGQPKKESDWMELDMFQKQREQFYTAEMEESYGDDDQNSLPDLNHYYEEPAADLPEEVWTNQPSEGTEYFAHETDYGYFYVHCDDMQKPPVEWDDQITQKSTNERRQLQRNCSRDSKQVERIPENAPINRKPLFQSRRPNHINIARAMKNNYVYDENVKKTSNDHDDSELIDHDNDIAINDNETEEINSYESDEEHAASRWTDFVNSQSSDDIDYLNQPLPDQLHGKSKLEQNFSETDNKTGSRDGPKLNQNLRKGILKQTLPTMNSNTGRSMNKQSIMNSLKTVKEQSSRNELNSGCLQNSVNSVKQRVSLKPSFLTKSSNMLSRENDFGIPGISKNKVWRKENKENIMNGSDRKGPTTKVSDNMKSNYWEDKVNAKWDGPNQNEALGSTDETKENEVRQKHKFGQVLAWVSNSQNKSESRSPSDWEDWGSDMDVEDEVKQMPMKAVENSSSCKQPTSENRALSEANSPSSISADKNKQQMQFSSFFSHNISPEKADSFVNIFDGIF